MKKLILLSSILFLSVSFICAQGLEIDLKTSSKELKKEIEHNAFIDRINDGESYQIQLASMGCFGGSESSITVSRKSDQYFASFEEFEIELADSDVNDFRGFEKELVNISKGYCTSTDNYTLIYKGEKLRVTDMTCSWNGFSRLKRKFRIG